MIKNCFEFFCMQAKSLQVSALLDTNETVVVIVVSEIRKHGAKGEKRFSCYLDTNTQIGFAPKALLMLSFLTH